MANGMMKQTQSGIRNFVIFLYALTMCMNSAQLLVNETVLKDWCVDITECFCQRHKDDNRTDALSASCEEYDYLLLDKLPMSNITRLELKHGATKSNMPILKNLRNKTNRLQKLSVLGGSLDNFALQWLPDTIEELAITKIDIKHFIPGNDNKKMCKKEGSRLTKLKTITLNLVTNLTNMPCFPDAITTLLMIDISIPESLRWPESLTRLKITSGGQHGYIPPNLFVGTENLKLLWVSFIPLQNGIMPHIPSSENLKFILFQSCRISTIQSDAFHSLKNLTTVNLSSNMITDITTELPKTVEYLKLYRNSIIKIAPYQWFNSSIRLLHLAHNNIRSVPLGLPNTLEVLNLAHNHISDCPPDAFWHLKSLKHLDLSHNELITMPMGIQPGLATYQIEYNLISHVPGPHAYNFCKQCIYFGFGNNKWLCDLGFFRMMLWMVTDANNEVLKKFYLSLHESSHGECRNLPENAFTVKYLNHTLTFVQQIRNAPFTNCSYESQEILNCTDANLNQFPNPPPDGLLRVVIEGNWNLKETPDFFFAQQNSLKTLELGRNNLKRIPYGLSSTIITLNLHQNNITELSDRDVEAFKNLINLKELFLEANKLKILYSTQFASLTSLRWIGLESNEFICDCSLQSFVLWYQNLVPRQKQANMLARYAKCKYPVEWINRDIRTLEWIYVYELQCVPPSCLWSEEDGMEATLNCSIIAQKEMKSFMFAMPQPVTKKLPNIPENTFWRSLILSGLELDNEDIELKYLENLVYVDFSVNYLTKWPIENLPKTIEELVMKNNRIAILPNKKSVDQYLPNLRSVDLRNNRIITLGIEELSLLPVIQSILMGGNPFECNCSLDHFIVWVKSNGSSLSQNGKYDWEDLRCSRPFGMERKRLQDISTEDICHTNAAAIIKSGIALTGFIIICISIGILVLHMRRRQKYRAQILTGFQKLLQQEAVYHMKEEMLGVENKVYKYDCFVASENTNQDNEFLDMLIQEFEQRRNLTVCITHRDFPPGVDVADNIVQCIGASKFIILLLSKSFISSPWCQYEVQVALTELHQRQRKLLVPILIEDAALENDISGSVKTFISLIPALRAPAKESTFKEWEKFWKTLEKIIH